MAAAEELFYAAAAVIRHLSFHRDPFVAIMQGGVLQHESYVREALMRRIEAYAPHVQWNEARREPIYGVVAMGLSYLEIKGGKTPMITLSAAPFMRATDERREAEGK